MITYTYIEKHIYLLDVINVEMNEHYNIHSAFGVTHNSSDEMVNRYCTSYFTCIFQQFLQAGKQQKLTTFCDVRIYCQLKLNFQVKTNTLCYKTPFNEVYAKWKVSIITKRTSEICYLML